MILKISTPIALPPAEVWQRLHRIETLEHVTRGLMGFQKLTPASDLFEGKTLTVRFVFFHLFPAPWTHQLQVKHHDPARMEVLTHEQGGPITTWNHRIRVQHHPVGTHYTDEVDIQAGLLTPLVYLYAWGFYHYRQWRWRNWA